MEALIEKTRIKNLYSFDIFDTLITRKTATPRGIFYLMQEMLKSNTNYTEFFRANFKNIRCETENFVRIWLFKNKSYQDITFDEIYEKIQINHSLTNEQTEFLKNLEIQCEINNLIPIEENVSKVKNLVAKGEKVILISDMYHSEPVLKKILTNIDPVFFKTEIYVSSHYRKTKSRGWLYKTIKEVLNPVYWEHTGDNKYADFASAKHHKIKANLYDYPKFKGYEKEALKNDNLSTEFVIGTAKNLRIKSHNAKYSFGASFAGPILYQYVNWILESTLKSNIEHLYFIARDGYIPKLIADIIIKEKKLPVKTHYLYGSRKAWRIPTETTVDDFITYIFSEYFDKFSTEFLCERFSITSSELEQYTGLKAGSKILKNKQRKKLFDKLIHDDSFKKFLVNKHKDRANLAALYLQQEIDFSKDNFAFVDMNGSGRTQDILRNLIPSSYKGTINTFYFCVELNLSEYKNTAKKIFMCSETYRHYWLELLCRTLYGQTTGYEDINGKIQPIFETINPQFLLNWGYNDYLNGILDFTRNFLAVDIVKDVDFYYKYFNFIMKNIDKETADIFGSIPYCDTGKEVNIKECAPAYNLLSYFTSVRNPGLIFISLGRSSKPVQALIKFKIKYKSLRKFLINIQIDRKRLKVNICLLGIKFDLHKLGAME